MGIKVVLNEAMPLPRALGALRVQSRRNGIQISKYVRQAERNRRKDYFEKPGVKRRRKRHLAAHRRRRGEMGFFSNGRP
jgi:Ribosomal protein S21